MTLALLFGLAIALTSIWGAAYLLRVWHEDAAAMRAAGTWQSWPFSRVLAYVAIACTLASNYLVLPTLLRLLGFPLAQAALTPITVAALVTLDVAFVVIAIYLRIVRSRS